MKKKRKNIELPPSTRLYVFDNGYGALFQEHDEPNLILCFQGFEESVLDNHLHLSQLNILFPQYNILYLENPTLPLSEYATPSNSILQVFRDIFKVYQCLLRYKRWNKIGFFGYDFGGILQAYVYYQSQQLKLQLPNWIMHCNAPKDLTSFVYHKIHWLFHFFTPRNKNVDLIHYYQSIECPLYIIHCRKNKKISFMDSILLHEKLKPKSTFIPIHGIHEKCLFSPENMELIASQLKKDHLP